MKNKDKLIDRVDVLRKRGYAAHEIAQHLRDEGQVVSVHTVRSMLTAMGFKPRRSQSPESIYQWGGQRWTLRELGRVHGVDIRVLRRRLRRGWTLITALRKPTLNLRREAVENVLGCAVFFPALALLIAVGHWGPV